MVNVVGRILFLLLLSFISVNGQLIDPPNDSTQTILNIKPLKKYLDDDIPGAAALNEDKQTIADAFTQQSYELLIRQVNVVGNGDTWITSAAKLDTAFIVGLPAWNSAHLVFQDVSGKDQVPFIKNDLLFAQIASPSGLTFDSNGTALDTDALIRRFVYVVDSVDGLNVFTIPHTDSLTPSNKGVPTFGDVFVKVGNISTGADLIKFEVDIASKDPRIEVFDNIKTWSDFINQDKKIVVIGNIGGEVTSLGTVADTVVGALFRGGTSGGNIILDNVDLKISNQGSIQISGFDNDIGFITSDSAGINTFIQTTVPPDSVSKEGDLWINTNTANEQNIYVGGNWSPYLGPGSGIGVLIDASGIYTGTLVANQITTGTLDADRIGANSITADKLDVDTLNSIVLTSSTIEASTLNTGGGFPAQTFIGNGSISIEDIVNGTTVSITHNTGATSFSSSAGTNTFSFNGRVISENGDSDDWDDAFSWGDHALAGYADSSDFSVGTPTASGYFVATSSGGSPTTELKKVVLNINGTNITVLTEP